jgi:hypothetical protein
VKDDDAKMVSMKNDPPKKGKGDTNTIAYPGMDRDAYPWGLRITLDQEQIKKLGIDVSKVPAEAVVNIEAKASVESISINRDTRDGKEQKRQSLTLQITDLSLTNQDDFDEAFEEATRGGRKE